MMEINNKKKNVVSNLKISMLSELEDGFVEHFEFWKAKMGMVNSIISHVDENAEVFNYNDFCKKTSDTINSTLDNEIDYEKLFLTESEFRKIEKEFFGNQEEMGKAVEVELNKKYEKNLRDVVEKRMLMEAVKQKLGDKFQMFEEVLEKSASIAIVMLKNNADEQTVSE